MFASIFHILPVAALAWGDYDWENPTENISAEVMSHSFMSPFTYDSSFDNWFISGSVIPTRQSRSSVVMNPAILGRQGIMWNTKRLETNDFDATLMLHIDSDQSMTGTGASSSRPSPPSNQKLGLWFSTTNVTKEVREIVRTVPAGNPNWKDSFVKQGLDYELGVPTKFEGIGFYLSPTNEKGEKSPTITLVSSKGKESPVNLFKSNKTSTLVYLRLKFKVRPDSFSVWYQESMEWRQICEAKFSVPKSMFVGLTSYSGSTEGTVPYRIRASSLHIKSFDLNALNTQDNQLVISMFEKHALPIKELLSDSSYADQVSQTRTMLKLARVLNYYMSVEIPALKRYQTTFEKLQKEVVGLEEFVTSLTREARYTFKKTDSKEGVAKMLEEVKNIHSSLVESQEDGAALLKDVLKDQEDGSSESRHASYYERQLHSRGEELNLAIESQNRFTLVMFLIVAGAAIIMGLSFYIKLKRYAEKAHMF